MVINVLTHVLELARLAIGLLRTSRDELRRVSDSTMRVLELRYSRLLVKRGLMFSCPSRLTARQQTPTVVAAQICATLGR